MYAENEELKRKTMAELASARAAAKAELEAVQKQISEEQATWQAERERISHTQKFQARVKVDVGGLKITTSRSTLQAVPGSMLDAYFSGRHTNETDEEGYHFIDRDGTHFRHILNFLRDPSNFSLELPGEQMKELLVEAEYYGLTQHMAGACPALAEMLRKKHLGWLADATVGCYVECKMPQAGVEYLYVDSMEMGSDGKPMQLDVIMVHCEVDEVFLGHPFGYAASSRSPASGARAAGTAAEATATAAVATAAAATTAAKAMVPPQEGLFARKAAMAVAARRAVGERARAAAPPTKLSEQMLAEIDETFSLGEVGEIVTAVQRLAGGAGTLMQFKQTIQQYLSNHGGDRGNKLAGKLKKKSGQPHAQEYMYLQQYGLVHECVTVVYDGANPALRGKSKKLQYACSINTG